MSSSTPLNIVSKVELDKLTPDQLKVFNKIVNEDKSIFMSGQAGSGKSYVINEIVKEFTNKKLSVYITALTGTAASNIGGYTVHHLFQLGLAKDTKDELIKKVQYAKIDTEFIKYADLLIIDEISMMGLTLFEKLEAMIRCARGMVDDQNLKHPFGGLKILLSGDFYQLPPISDDFCFKSPFWSYFETIILYENVRQKTDLMFQTILDEIRDEKLSPQHLIKLKSTIHNDLNETNITDSEENINKYPILTQIKIKPTKLYSQNKYVDSENQYELENTLNTLKVNLFSYSPVAKGDESKKYLKTQGLDNDVVICVGAQVMHTINNNNDKIFNGSRGVVVDCIKTKYENKVTVKFKNGIKEIYMHEVKTFYKKSGSQCVKIDIAYMPLRLAWSMTIHKSQGATLDSAIINLDPTNLFGLSLGYVALSRVRELNDVKLTVVEKNSFKIDKNVKKFYSDIESKVIESNISAISITNI